MSWIRFLASTLAAVFLAVLWFHGGHILVLPSEPEFDAQAIRADITIKSSARKRWETKTSWGPCSLTRSRVCWSIIWAKT